MADFLLRRGHSVTLVDSDAEMLMQARQRLAAADLLSRCRLMEGNLDNLLHLLPADHFEIIVAHHVLEYLRDAPTAMKSLYALTKKGGEFSLITLNPGSEVMRAIIFQGEPGFAQSKLTDLYFDSKWFGQATLYPMDQILAWAADAGWSLNDFRGVRILADYLPAASLTETKKADLYMLEENLAGLEPYRRFGRYLQFAFRKI
jgi:SAM-dependent methyltransferase